VSLKLGSGFPEIQNGSFTSSRLHSLSDSRCTWREYCLVCYIL